jgi:hypothetical protein
VRAKLKQSLWTIGIAMLLGAGCGGPPSRGEPGESCSRVPVSCSKGRLESCCSSTQCTYRVSDGTDFPCDGRNCNAAAEQAVAYCKS